MGVSSIIPSLFVPSNCASHPPCIKHPFMLASLGPFNINQGVSSHSSYSHNTHRKYMRFSENVPKFNPKVPRFIIISLIDIMTILHSCVFTISPRDPSFPKNILRSIECLYYICKVNPLRSMNQSMAAIVPGPGPRLSDRSKASGLFETIQDLASF